MLSLNLPPFCKQGKDICECEIRCYPALLLELLEKESKIPKKYQKLLPNELPIKSDNAETHKLIMRYCSKIPEVIQKGVGLYLYSISSNENHLGTGVGKTSTACALANLYMRERIVEHVKSKVPIESNPVLFLSCSHFQNIYNAQFSGSFETKEAAAVSFQNLFKIALKCELLILDDVAIRGGETFLNFLYELVDERNNEEKAIIATSNVPLDKTAELLGDRITSRLSECTTPLGFTGKDHRRGSF